MGWVRRAALLLLARPTHASVVIAEPTGLTPSRWPPLTGSFCSRSHLSTNRPAWARPHGCQVEFRESPWRSQAQHGHIFTCTAFWRPKQPTSTAQVQGQGMRTHCKWGGFKERWKIRVFFCDLLYTHAHKYESYPVQAPTHLCYCINSSCVKKCPKFFQLLSVIL